MKEIRRKLIGGSILFLVFFNLVVVLPGFLIAEWYCAFTGNTATIAVRLLSSVLWLLIAYPVFHLLFGAVRKHHMHKGHKPPTNMFGEVLEALDKIASGDFDVYVEEESYFRYSELAEKVNKLAKDLSSMEQMRQEFVSNVSHEIQSPLTSIRGFAALLKKENLPEERRLHYLEVIEAESSRLSKLSENLLKLSLLDTNQQPITLKTFRLDKQIQGIILLLEPQWSEKGIDLDVSLEKAELCGDEDLLSQIWINLLHNSIKFTEAEGKISVALTQDEETITCTVSDSGVGIPEESLSRIFERFYKADKARDRSLGGNGLGLSLVKKIVDLHHGKICVQSKLEKGTSFTVILPKTVSED